MKNTSKMFSIIAIVSVFILSSVSCFSQSLNSPEALKDYLNKQPANSPDKPIRVSMGANVPMLPKITEAINSAGKYVSLNLSGDTLTVIPDRAFEGCKILVGITIPNSVKSIGNYAFNGCSGLTSIIIPNNVTSIGESAFSGSGLTSIIIPNNITSIEFGTFISCINLTSVIIPNSVTSIKNCAFQDCTSLSSVTIPSSVKSIGAATFEDCTRLISVTFQCKISSNNFGVQDIYGDWLSPFDGDLRDKYLAGGIGTYTTTASVQWNSVWTKQ